MQKRVKEVERLSRFARHRPEGISPQCARILLDMPSMYRVSLGCSHVGIPSGVGTVVALPGGVVRSVKRFYKRLPKTFQ